MKILLLSPYDAVSHQYWHNGLTREISAHAFTVVTLPARYFNWRFRGNSLTLAHDARIHGEYDLILATSMTDVASLKAMRSDIADVPVVLYFHENQFDYPASEDDPHRVDRQLTSLYSALASDRIVFNTVYNERTFLGGVAALLDRMPDHVPAGVVDQLASRSSVLGVPLAREAYQSPRRDEVPAIVWNHRWEFDKGPGLLLEVVEGLIQSGFKFRFHLVGQQFRNQPEPFDECVGRLREAGALGARGFQPRADYLELLAGASAVLSTALQEFQGLSVMEAVASGCVPVVPDRLSYPELFASDYRYDTAAAAVTMLQRACKGEISAPDMRPAAWDALRGPWLDVLESAAKTG